MCHNLLDKYCYFSSWKNQAKSKKWDQKFWGFTKLKEIISENGIPFRFRKRICQPWPPNESDIRVFVIQRVEKKEQRRNKLSMEWSPTWYCLFSIFNNFLIKRRWSWCTNFSLKYYKLLFYFIVFCFEFHKNKNKIQLVSKVKQTFAFLQFLNQDLLLSSMIAFLYK